MKTIQIRNVPEEVHRKLRARAAEAGLSLSDFALAELERVAAHPTVADVLTRARALAETGGVRADVVVETIRRLRDER